MDCNHSHCKEHCHFGVYHNFGPTHLLRTHLLSPCHVDRGELWWDFRGHVAMARLLWSCSAFFKFLKSTVDIILHLPMRSPCIFFAFPKDGISLWQISPQHPRNHLLLIFMSWRQRPCRRHPFRCTGSGHPDRVIMKSPHFIAIQNGYFQAIYSSGIYMYLP